MNEDVDSAPSLTRSAFKCPFCRVFAHQEWLDLYAAHRYSDRETPNDPESGLPWIAPRPVGGSDLGPRLTEIERNIEAGKTILGDTDRQIRGRILNNVWASFCQHCSNASIWVHDRLVFPVAAVPIEPDPDMPEDIKELFNEARQVAAASPRSAAALLRLCIERLCKHLGEQETSLNNAIANLVKKGLDPTVQQMLDSVRVIGNHAVHLGTLDASDNDELVLNLFEIINLIVKQMISYPKEVKKIYSSLPANDRGKIARRDRTAPNREDGKR